MKEYYDLAIYIHKYVTLGKLYNILGALECAFEMESNFQDANNIELQDNGLFLTVQFPEDVSIESVEKLLSNFKGAEVDWDTMSDWM